MDALVNQFRGKQTKIFEENYHSRVQNFYKRTLLPELEKNGQEWGKASRQRYSFLKRSIWFDKHNHIHEQIHKKSFHAIDENYNKIFVPGQKQIIKGQGSDKIVKALTPFDPSYPEIVTARFYRKNLTVQGIERRINTVFNLKEALKGEETEGFLLPYTFSYTNSKGMTIYVQIMPCLEETLDAAIEQKHLSDPQKLQIAFKIAIPLTIMHKKGWIHCDIKPENIGLMKQDDEIIVKLIDFDYSNHPEEYHLLQGSCTPLYADPHLISQKAVGPEDGKVHDQFGFGATLYDLFTDTQLRGDAVEETDLVDAVKKEDLILSKNYKKIDKKIQKIIKQCCLGERKNRAYHLDKMIPILKDLYADSFFNEP